ncbi:hypothetical protein JCM11491_004306 [Sporobolomyces phaffii]
MRSSVVAYLPPEIIDEILRQKRLSKSDLASLCLVNKTWLKSARHSLYSSLDIVFDTFGLEEDAAEEENRDHGEGAADWTTYLTLSTSRLLTTLLSNPTLGRLTESLCLNALEGGRGTPTESVVLMRPTEALANFAQLCPSVTTLEVQSKTWGLHLLRRVINLRLANLEHVVLDVIVDEDWRVLQRLAKLRTITADDADLNPTRNPPDPLQQSIVRYATRDCVFGTFDIARAAFSQSIRELVLPVDAAVRSEVCKIRTLSSLTLVTSTSESFGHLEGFFADLRESKSLRTFGVEGNYSRLISDLLGGSLGNHFPVGLRRFNVGSSDVSADLILSSIARRENGSRIEQVGVAEDCQPDTRSVCSADVRNIWLFAVRATLEAHGVELIWY